MIGDVGDVGHVVEVARAVGQDRRRHQLQHGVLGPAARGHRRRAGPPARTTMRSIGPPVCSPGDGAGCGTGWPAADPVDPARRSPTASRRPPAPSDVEARRLVSPSADGPVPRATGARSSGRRRRRSWRRPSTTWPSRGSGWLFAAAGAQLRCGARPADATAAAVVGAARPARRPGRHRARPARRGVPRPSATSTRCSPRRSTSPPTSSAPRRQAQGVAGTVVRFGIVFAIGLSCSSPTASGGGGCCVAAAVLPRRCCARSARSPRRSPWLTVDPDARAAGRASRSGCSSASWPPRRCRGTRRAYAISLLAMATGLGAGLRVMALPLADLGVAGLAPGVRRCRLAFLVVAVDLRPPPAREPALRGAPRTSRRRCHRRRFALLAGIGLRSSTCSWRRPSFFQNRYLKDVRGYSATPDRPVHAGAPTRPGGVGVVVGGRLADIHGRRHRRRRRRRSAARSSR